ELDQGVGHRLCRGQRSPLTAPLGGAGPVLQVRDSRLRWDVDTDGSGSVSVGDVTLSGCSFVTVTVLTRPLARLCSTTRFAPVRTLMRPVRGSATRRCSAGS